MKFKTWVIWLGLISGCLGLILVSWMIPVDNNHETGQAKTDTITLNSEEKIDLPQKNLESCLIKKSFSPAVRQWCRSIGVYAENNQLDPNLVAAIMTVESGGNPNAISRSGAVGLLQVMPRDGFAATFSCINGPCFANRPTKQALLDPDFNIAFGTNLLADYFKKTGDIREALMAYGPMDMGYAYADKVLALYRQ